MPSNPLTQEEINDYAIGRILNPSGYVGLSPYMPQGYFLSTPALGDGPALWRLFDASFISSGTIDPDRLGTGATTLGNLYLADDGTWKAVGGATLDSLTDVTISAPANAQVLTYNSTTLQWENQTPTAGGGGNMNKSTYDVDNDGVVDSAETTQIIVRNSTGSTLLKGQVVYLSGATGNRPNAVLSRADTEVTATKTIGIVVANISNNSDGYVAVSGTLHNLDTSAFADGVAVWLSATTAGGMTSTIPAEPNHTVFIGYIARSHPTQGRLVIVIQNGYELNELHGVLISSEANNDLLVYESSSTLWKNKSISTIFGGTPLVSVPTLAQVTTAGNTTTNAITVGGLTVDTNTLYVDATNNRVGVGTLVPLDTLNVSGSNAPGVAVTSTTFTQSSAGRASLALLRLNTSTNAYIGWDLLKDVNDTLAIRYLNSAAAASENVRLWTNGNVTIQTGGTFTDAGYKLDVNGTGRFSSDLFINGSFRLRYDANNNASLFGGINFTTGQQNLVIGTATGFNINSGSYNTLLGHTAGQGLYSGTGNTFVGWRTGGSINPGNAYNSFLGYEAGRLADTSYSVFLGYQAGYSEATTNKLYIANSSTATPLIGGDFTKLRVGINVAPASIVSVLQVAGSITAASLLAQGVYFNNTLVAAANSDVLVGLDINPTFTNGAFTGVSNYAVRVKGATSTASSFGAYFINSSNQEIFQVRNDGAVKIGGGTFFHPTVTLFQVNTLAGSELIRLSSTSMLVPNTIGNLGGLDLTITGNSSLVLKPGNGNLGTVSIGGNVVNSVAYTNATRNFLTLDQGWNAVTGSSNLTMNALSLFNVINFTNSTGTNIARGIYIYPTLTSVSDYRAIETVVGNVIFGSTSGNVLIGTTTNSGYKLDVVGDINTTTSYRVGGVAGWTGTITIIGNPPGQQNVHVSGGIITNVT